MAGQFTRTKYDVCSSQQDTKRRTDPLELIFDISKYVNSKELCSSTPKIDDLIDIESNLRGIDKIASKCNTKQCSFNGCINPNKGQYTTPYACERGRDGENAVITTNLKKC